MPAFNVQSDNFDRAIYFTKMLGGHENWKGLGQSREYDFQYIFNNVCSQSGVTDRVSQSLMTLAGITHSRDLPSSCLLAILPPLLQTSHTAEGIADVIRSKAPNTQVKVFAHHPVDMPVAKRTRLSLREKPL